MRSEIGKAVRKTFNRKMLDRLPQFVEEETFDSPEGRSALWVAALRPGELLHLPTGQPKDVSGLLHG